MSHAGHQFLCVCCLEPHDEAEATKDPEIEEGPICGMCDFRLKHAKAALKKHAKCHRAVNAADIEGGAVNHKRFQIPE